MYAILKFNSISNSASYAFIARRGNAAPPKENGVAG